MRSELASTYGRTSLASAYPICATVSRNSDWGSAAAQAAEDGERILRQDLVDELARGLDVAVQPSRQLASLVFGGRTHEDVPVALEDAMAFAAESGRKLDRSLRRTGIDAHLPRCVATVEQIALRLELLGELVVPALFVGEPVLDLAHGGVDVVLAELRFDDAAGLLGFGARSRVDVDPLIVARDRQATPLELLRELARLGAEVETEPLEKCVGVLLCDVDLDSPVVVHAGILSNIPRCSRCLVIPPSQNGKPAPRSRAVSTSLASAT